MPFFKSSKSTGNKSAVTYTQTKPAKKNNITVHETSSKLSFDTLLSEGNAIKESSKPAEPSAAYYMSKWEIRSRKSTEDPEMTFSRTAF